MTDNRKRIGLMGGTFDPPHLAHIIPVEVTAAEFHLDWVWFVPALVPPHKMDHNRTDPFHRSAMLALALKNFPSFRLSTIELLRGDISFTINTLRELKSRLRAEDLLFFIMGSDSFLEIDTWFAPAELLSSCEFIVINRGATGEELLQNLRKLEKKFQISLEKVVHFGSAAHLPYSSTQIRQLVQQGADISQMVFPEVETYIQKHSLYRR